MRDILNNATLKQVPIPPGRDTRNEGLKFVISNESRTGGMRRNLTIHIVDATA
jgi:hypothetical protein